MKAIIQDIIIGTLGLWFAQWFVPREDYEWLQHWALKVEGMARKDRDNHEQLIDQRAADMVKIEQLVNALQRAPNPHTCGVSDLAHWTREFKEPALRSVE